MNCMKTRSIDYNVLKQYVQVYVTNIFRFTPFSLWKAALYKVYIVVINHDKWYNNSVAWKGFREI